MGKWKGCRENGPGNPVELYNLESDRSEFNHVAAEYSEIVQKMEAVMAAEHEPTKTWNFTENWSQSRKSRIARKAPGKTGCSAFSFIHEK
jgi:hypothetical protein